MLTVCRVTTERMRLHLRRRLGVFAIGLALSLALLLPIAPEAAADLNFTFLGGGYGHSVGMSQYGAYGMAREGYTWQEILSHYFTGAGPAAADPALLAAPLWVGLTQERTRVEWTVVATGAAPAAPAIFTQGTASLDGERRARRWSSTGWAAATAG